MHIHTKARIIAGIWLIFCAVLSSPAATVGNFERVAFSAPELEGAQHEARASFDVFLKHAGQPGADPAVKIRLAPNTLPVWVYPHIDGANRIIAITEDFDQIDVTRGDIFDWSLTGSDGRLHGNFITRAFAQANHLPTKRLLAKDPLPVPEGMS